MEESSQVTAAADAAVGAKQQINIDVQGVDLLLQPVGCIRDGLMS